MSRGIVVGITWYDSDLGDRVERVASGPDAKVRDVVDRLVKASPDNIRRDVARFLAPLLENNEPSAAAKYSVKPMTHWVWWKRCYIEET